MRLLALELLAVWACVYAALQGLGRSTLLTIFQARDIDRAWKVASGRWVLFGPEMCGGGHLPGGFFYVLLAAALKVRGSWRACWQLDLLLLGAAGALLWVFARRRFGTLPACVAAAWLLTSPLALSVAASFQNPSYVPFFAVAALICLYGTFVGGGPLGPGAAWIAFCLLCGLGLQLHFSFATLLAAGVLLAAGARRLGLEPLGRKPLLAGVGVFAAALSPYAIWLLCRAAGLHLGEPDLPYTGADALPWRGVWLRLGAVPHQTIAQSAREVLKVVPLGHWLALALLAAPYARRRLLSGAPPRPSDERRARGLRVLAACCALSLLPALVPLLAADDSAPRYALIFVLTASVGVAWLAAGPGDVAGWACVAAYAALALDRARAALPVLGREAARDLLAASVAGVVLGLLSWRGREDAGGPRAAVAGRCAVAASLPLLVALSCQRPRGPVRVMEEISRQIRAETGWDYDEARRRLFFVGLHPVASLASVYRETKTDRAPSGAGAPAPDGYFIGMPILSTAPTRGWPRGERLPAQLEAAISDGGLRLSAPSRHGAFFVTAYTVEDRERLPRFFHDRSDGYSLLPAPDLPARPGARTFELSFNDSPRRAARYDVTARVQLERSGPGAWSVRIVWDGEPISQANYWLSPDHVEKLERPFFAYSCGRETRKVALADALGAVVQDGDDQTLLAPYERAFHVACARPLTSFSVGYESALAFSYRELRPRSLPGSVRVVRLP